MNAKYLIFAIPVMVLCACNKENSKDLEQCGTVSFTAIANTGETKTTVETDGSTYTMTWTGNESAKVRELLKESVGWEGTSLWKDVATPTYTFTNSRVGTYSTFTSESFTPGEFAADHLYLIRTPNPTYTRVEYHRANASSSTVDKYALYDRIPNNQVYNESNSMGLADNIIPLYGLVEKDRGGEYEPSFVRMHTSAAIVKLVVTNSGSAKTIDHITMESAKTDKGCGLAGSVYCLLTPSNPNSSLAVYTLTTGTDTYFSLITLDCGDVSIANGETKIFSFVVAPIGRTGYQGNFTWKIYEDGNDTPISVEENTSGTQLQAGKVYKKAITL